MSKYRVINPNIPKLNDLALITWNARWWAIEFKKTLGEEAHREKEYWESKQDEWLKKNVELVPQNQENGK